MLWLKDIKLARRLAMAVAVIALGVTTVSAWRCPPASGVGPPGTDKTAQRTASLIRRLGDDEFAVRERAESELAGLGLAALDALADAQFDDDVEIAVRARRLLRSIQVRWVSDRDSKQVRQILSGYGNLPSDRRRDVIDRLAKLPQSSGLVAVARLARYEPSPRIAKYAALAILKAPTPSESVRSRVAREMERAIDGSGRESVTWVAAALRIWHTPSNRLAEWDKIVDREESTFAIHPEQSGRALLRRLLFAHVEILIAAEKLNKAERTAARMLPLVDDDRGQLMETADWLLQHEWTGLVESFYQRFHDGFQQNTALMFRLAEARRRSGNLKSANEAAEAAAGNVAASGPKALWLLGMNLQNDGFFHWAEFAYRKIIDVDQPQWSEISPVFITVAEMLHDLKRDGDAAEVMKRLIQAAQEERLRTVIERETRQPLEVLAARAAFFEACDQGQKGNAAAQHEALRRALASAPNDADVLIALYRSTKSDPKRFADARKQIDAATTYYRDRIEATKKRINQSRSKLERMRGEMEVAQDSNQVAWLISNTEGDVRWAIECSRESLALYPDSAGFRDTLARCYFANGDIDRAIEEQRAAIKAEPHSPPLQAQLETFLAAQERAGDATRRR